MFDALMQLGLFTAKIFIVFLFILLLLVAFFGLIAKSRGKLKGKLSVKNLNQKYAEK